MPRPCPKCQRPIPATRSACVYCGAKVAPAEAPAPATVVAAIEPRTFDSPLAMVALTGAAAAAHQRGDVAEAARMMARPFAELAPNERRQVLIDVSRAWIDSIRPVASKTDLALCEENSARAADLVMAGRNEEAARFLEKSRPFLPAGFTPHPGRELLLLGLRGSGKDLTPKPAPIEPRTLDSREAIHGLIAAAHQALNGGAAEEAARMMGRVFRETAPGDRRQLVLIAGQSWAQSVRSFMSDADLAVAMEKIQRAAALAATDRNLEAGAELAEARRGVPPGQKENPALSLFMLGLMGARIAQKDDAERDQKYSALVSRASQLIVAPGRRAEGIALFREALALLPDPPVAEKDRVRAERLRQLLSAEDAAEPAEGSVQSVLPPEAALSASGWHAMSLQMLGNRLAEAALVCVERAIARDGSQAPFWVTKARVLEALERPAPEVADCYARALARDPDLAEARAGLTMLKGADAPAAATALQPLLARAVEALSRNQDAAALAWLDQVLEQEPDHVSALSSKGFALYRLACSDVDGTRGARDAAGAQARLAQAIGCVRRALQRQPHEPTAMMVLAQSTALLRKLTQAASTVN